MLPVNFRMFCMQQYRVFFTLNLWRLSDVNVKTSNESRTSVVQVTVWSQTTREHVLIAYMEGWNHLLYTVGEFISWGLRSSLQRIPGLGLHTAKQKDEIVALFNNMRTQKSTNKWLFRHCQSNVRRLLELPTSAERVVIKSLTQRFDYSSAQLSTVQTTKQCSAVVGSWEEPPNISLTVTKTDPFVGSAWILDSTCYWQAQ